MGKKKLIKFKMMESFSNVFYVAWSELQENGFGMKGDWNKEYFKNDNPIVLELGCGKGEYTVGLAKQFPEKNFIGIDIKGARIFSGAKEAIDGGLDNVAFIRTTIDQLPHFFGPHEVSEIWITFPDPQMKRAKKRLTGTRFQTLYRQVLKENGLMHLKTDSDFLYAYTDIMLKENHFDIKVNESDLYNDGYVDSILSIKTFYEQQWLDRGKTIKYLQWEMHLNPLIEPDVEIEFDDYRSFGRVRRGPNNMTYQEYLDSQKNSSDTEL